MAWVYTLRGSSGPYYLGSTTDRPRRLDQHRNGYTYFTRRLGIHLGLIPVFPLPDDLHLVKIVPNFIIAA